MSSALSACLTVRIETHGIYRFGFARQFSGSIGYVSVTQFLQFAAIIMLNGSPFCRQKLGCKFSSSFRVVGSARCLFERLSISAWHNFQTPFNFVRDFFSLRECRAKREIRQKNTQKRGKGRRTHFSLENPN